MAVIKSENWDGVTAPAMPSGWNFATGFVTNASASVSAPNRVANATNVVGDPAYWNTSDDGNGGDAQASSIFKADFEATICKARIYCRMTTPAIAVASLTSYYAEIDFVGNTVSINKVVAGTITNLASRSAPAFGTTEKYRVCCVTVGRTITARVQRLSDSKWLDNTNAWQTAQQDYSSATDSAISGSGKAGIGFLQFNSSDLAWGDDFLFETAVATTDRRRASTSFI